MKVARWGNSLAVRIPRPLIDALGLREGDEVSLSAAARGRVAISKDRGREDAIARIRTASWPLPADYRFDRADANGRDVIGSDRPRDGG